MHGHAASLYSNTNISRSGTARQRSRSARFVRLLSVWRQTGARCAGMLVAIKIVRYNTAPFNQGE